MCRVAHDGSIGFTLLTYPEYDAKMDRFGLNLDWTEVNWTELSCSAFMFQTKHRHGCDPAEPASVSPGKIIVAPPCPSVSIRG